MELTFANFLIINAIIYIFPGKFLMLCMRWLNISKYILFKTMFIVNAI